MLTSFGWFAERAAFAGRKASSVCDPGEPWPSEHYLALENSELIFPSHIIKVV